MTGWHQRPLAAWDLETTSANPDEARIVTCTIVTIDGPRIHERNWLVDPGVEISAEAAAIHGVTTERARAEGMPAAVAAHEIASELDALWAAGVPVVVYNAAYDSTVLHRELCRHDLQPLADSLAWAPIIDPLTIDRRVDRYRKGKRTLTAACSTYQVTIGEAHTSSADAVAAARVAWRIAQQHPEIAAMDPMQLHDLQAQWHAAWAAEFEQYLTRQGKPERIERDWPVRPLVERAAVLS